jgi:hypothetical protein
MNLAIVVVDIEREIEVKDSLSVPQARFFNLSNLPINRYTQQK